MKRLLFCLGLFLLMVSCGESRYRVPRSCPSPELRMARYDREFFQTGHIADSAFWSLYCENILQAGSAGDTETRLLMDLFRQDPDIARLYEDCQERISSTQTIEQQVNEAFRRLCHYIPNMPVPALSAHISGFGQSIVSAPDRLSVSLDKYLGSDYPLYEQLFYDYQWHRMTPEHIAPDCLNGWIRSEFTHDMLMSDYRLLDYLVYEGKLLFLLSRIFPSLPQAWLAGWDDAHFQWCRDNEARMWQRIQEYDHLLSRDPIVLKKYIGDGPTTLYFTEEAPARAAIWNGYRLVCAYMEALPDISIVDMMMETDAGKILDISLYRPASAL